MFLSEWPAWYEPRLCFVVGLLFPVMNFLGSAKLDPRADTQRVGEYGFNGGWFAGEAGNVRWS